MPIYIETLNSLSTRTLEKCLQDGRFITNSIKPNCLYIDSILPSLSTLEKQLGLNFKKLNFTFDDIRDDHGTTIGWKITYEGLQKVLYEILNYPTYSQLFQSEACRSKYFFVFLQKSIANTIAVNEYPTLWLTLLKIHVVSWYNQNRNTDKDQCIFIMENRPWKAALSAYANTLNISLQWQPSQRAFKEILKKQPYRYPKIAAILKSIKSFKRKGVSTLNGTHSKIALESVGTYNLQKPELFSDIFYWHQSQLSAKNLLLYCTRPVTEKQWNECNNVGISLIGLSTKHYKKTPVFSSLYQERFKLPTINYQQKTLENQLYQDRIAQYNYQKNSWLNFFDQTNTKIHVTHFKYDNSHIPKADALNELGGINTLWQLSYEELPSPVFTIIADVVFGFSSNKIATEKLNNSQIRYHIATGYPGDYRFPIVKPKAEQIRKKLKANGAKKIITFFDENSSEDGRWAPSHSSDCDHHKFLLEKLLSEPWLGVIFKPKKPHTLRKRLKAIQGLFEDALDTGRCHVFMAEASGIPPAVAALSADVVIQGTLWTATAGIESALTGVPTLLMDPDNWHMSQLYQLGEGKVVFQKWQHLWETLVEHWNTSQGIPGFGDWSPILNELDPFRDGKAGERIGNYLHWLIQGFEQGLDRDTILADATERYSQQWGYDKITSTSV